MSYWGPFKSRSVLHELLLNGSPLNDALLNDALLNEALQMRDAGPFLDLVALQIPHGTIPFGLVMGCTMCRGMVCKLETLELHVFCHISS